MTSPGKELFTAAMLRGCLVEDPNTAASRRCSSAIALLARARRSQGMSCRKLARLARITERTLEAVERGNRPLKLHEFLTICTVLGLDPCKVLGDEP